MPGCVPVSNGVGDINANQKPPAPPSKSSDSKLSKIMTCLFWRKKTDVVDMTKETADVVKKQKITVDRSDRSRRVLKMESMRTAPKTREEDDAMSKNTQGQTQMFLPSENPTASFLSYLNPSVRRACSEVIRTSGPISNNKPLTREAFTDGKRKIITRNTNYRGQRAGGTLPRANDGSRDLLGKPPKPPDRHGSNVKEVNKPIVVPGVTSCSDDDVGYDSDNDITDLHDEIRRMNMSQPDLRTSSVDGSAQARRRRREGSISLSEDDGDMEGGEIEDIEDIDNERPQNPMASRQSNDVRAHAIPDEATKHCKRKTKSMEDVIDDLFKQTQSNIDMIYQNGLENIDMETFRSDTATPDTCMKRLEEDLLKPSNGARARMPLPTEGNGKGSNGQNAPVGSPEMDSLLTEVSQWAQDRQQWLLADGKLKESNTRESSMTSATMEEKAIEKVSRSNANMKDRCSNWVHDQRQLSEEPETVKVGGILTGPKLFRSTARNPAKRTVSFGDSDDGETPRDSSNHSSVIRSEPTRVEVPSRRASSRLQILDLHNDNDDVISAVKSENNNGEGFPEPWSPDMYMSVSKCELDRSTLNDNLSELDEKVGFRARSPGSWLSSNGSCSNLMKEQDINDADDCFEVPRGINGTPDTARTPDLSVVAETNVVKATNVAKSHQILRQAPKVHTPFKGLDKTPVPTTPAIPNRPLLKNTQLKPLSLRSSPPKTAIDHFPALPGMKGTSHSFMTSRNMNNHDNTSVMSGNRPFSEIPLTTSDYSLNRSNNGNGLPQGPDSSHPYIQAMMRPLSETTSQKRGGKIGMGPIMATKDKQTYARDIINAIEKQRLQPQQDAFHINIPTPVPENTQEEETQVESGSKTEEEPKKKRHKVFTNSLIRGGYSYDKHSRKDNRDSNPKNSQSFSGKHGSNEQAPLTYSQSFQTGSNPATASVSDLMFSMRDSVNGYGGNMTSAHNDTVPTQVYEHRYMNGYQNSDSLQARNANMEPANVNRNNSLQTHSLGSNYVKSDSSTNVGHHQTAEKFRKLRSRRDQEMEWLMKDAAETEV